MTARLLLRLAVALTLVVLAAPRVSEAAEAAKSLPRLKVAENKRFLADESGRPFFWLADTAWQLLHDLGADEQQRYFADRRQKGFNVVQTVILVELRGDRPNAFGHQPIEPRRPDRPIVRPGADDDYWDDIARSLALAEKHGIYLALLPTWGKNVTSNWQNGLVDGFFTVENAEAYGRFLGSRFKDHANIVWVLGGDRAAPTDPARAIWRSLARGIVLGLCGREDYSAALMTYHTSGPGSTAWFLNNEAWMDFHGLQSGHGRWAMNWIWVEHAYSMKPVMPVIDLETSYPEFRHGRPPTTTPGAPAIGPCLPGRQAIRTGITAFGRCTPRSIREWPTRSDTGSMPSTLQAPDRWATCGGCSSRGRSPPSGRRWN